MPLHRLRRQLETAWRPTSLKTKSLHKRRWKSHSNERRPSNATADPGTANVRRYGEVVIIRVEQEVYDHRGQPRTLLVYLAGEGAEVQVDIAYLPGEDSSRHTT